MNMTDSQFKTFRADVKREVRNIAHEIRSELCNTVVEDSRRVAAATARNHVDQIAMDGELYDLSEIRQALTTLNSDMATVVLATNGMEGRLWNVEHELTKQIVGELTHKKRGPMNFGGDPTPVNCTPKEWDVLPSYSNGRFTFYRGEWRRDSQMKEFARQARHRFNKATEDFRAAQSDVNKFSALGL